MARPRILPLLTGAGEFLRLAGDLVLDTGDMFLPCPLGVNARGGAGAMAGDLARDPLREPDDGELARDVCRSALQARGLAGSPRTDFTRLNALGAGDSVRLYE